MSAKRCSQCVLSENTPNITFDENGVCSYCHTYEPFQYKGEDQLKQEIDKLRDDNKEFEAMVMISGGRDSSYVALKVAKDYNLRVLAVNYDSIFTHPQAKENIENIKNKLGIPVVQIRDERKIQYNAFRDITKTWFKKPSVALTPLFCIGCKLAHIGIYRVAKKYGINCLIAGQNPYEVISYKRELIGVSRDQEFASGHHKSIKAANLIVSNPGYFKPRTAATMATAYLFGSPLAIGVKVFFPKVKWIPMFEYLPWNEKEILTRIQSELAWDYPRELKSTWRFDCRVKHLADCVYLSNLGMTDKDDFYSKLVREKQFTREKALERLEVENKIHFDEIEKVFEASGFTDVDFFDEYVASFGDKN